MLFSEVRLDGIPLASRSVPEASPAYDQASHPVTEVSAHPDTDPADSSAWMQPVAHALANENGGASNKLFGVKRSPRHAVIQVKPTSTTPPAKRDDVKIEKMDFSCVDNRRNLSFPDMLRQIGRSFKNPVGQLANEAQVIHYVRAHNRCPTAKEIEHLSSITLVLDQTLTLVTGLISGSQPLAVTQTIGGPLFEMIADSLEGRETNVDELAEATEQFLALAQSIKKYSPRDQQGKILTNQLIVPKSMSFKNNKLSVEIGGRNHYLTHRDGSQFASYDGKYEEVSYSWKTREWFKINTGKKIQVFLADGKTTVTLIPTQKERGWEIYRRIDSETAQPFGESYVVSKKGRLIAYEKVKSEIRRNKEEEFVPEKTACGIGVRAKRAPCTINETPNPLGLLEQRGFPGKLYRADRRSPVILSGNEGFYSSDDFSAIEKMTDNDRVLIVAESLEGALRYIHSQGEVHYIYEIEPKDVRGVSLKANIHRNADGVKKFLSVLPEKGDDIDWTYETNGAVFLDEAHVYTEDIKIDKIKYLGKTTDAAFKNKIENLDTDRWNDYVRR